MIMNFDIAMVRRRPLRGALVSCLCLFLASVGHAEPDPAAIGKLLTIIGAIGEEYREAIEDGQVVRPVEYEEALAFLADARSRLPGLGLDAAVVGELEEVGADVEKRIRDLAPVDEVVTRVGVMRNGVAQAAGVSGDVFPPASPSMARGAALFAGYCSGCHGAAGDGRGPDAAQLQPPPANFRDRAFMAAETPYDFFHVISLGRRNTAMPAWDEALSTQERWDLVSFLWTLADGAGGITEGRGIYQAHCASCHGDRGAGNGAAAAKLARPPADLSRIESLSRKPNAELIQAITEGIDGTAMPAFSSMLDEEQRVKVAAYLRVLSMGGWIETPAVVEAAGEITRFRGLLAMLARAYQEASAAAPNVAETEWIEVGALAVQVATHAPVVEQHLAAVAPDAAVLGRQRIDEVVRGARERAPIAQLTKPLGEIQMLLQQHLPQAASPSSAVVPSEAPTPALALAASRAFLAQALSAYQRGDAGAVALVSDAYFEFEPLERHLGGVAPGLKAAVEERFLRLRQELRQPNNEAAVRTLIDEIEVRFGEAERALQPRTHAWGVIVQSAGIIVREGFEVILVIGALASYVTRSGQLAMRRYVYTGTGVGVVVSLLTAYVLEEVLRRNPGSADMLEGFTMLLAAVVLFWVSYWLISKAEADRWQHYIKSKVQNALSTGSGLALAGTAFLAVYREGFETVLFFKALFAGAAGQGNWITVGILIGGVLLALVYVAFRRFQARLPMAQFFMLTGAFLYLMAAIFAGQGIKELQEVGLVSDTAVRGVPTLPMLGVFPSLETLLAQGLFVAMLIYALVTLRRRAQRHD